MNKSIWTTFAFLSLFSFHLVFSFGLFNEKHDPIKSCENVMDKLGEQNNLIKLAVTGRENHYRFYRPQDIKPGFEKRPDFIVGEASILANNNTDYECKVSLYN